MTTGKILITPCYKTQSSERNAELDYVLKKNIESNIFDKIILFCDPNCIPPYTDERIEIIIANNRPTYLDFFNQGNNHTGSIIVISNSDIFFDESINISKKYIKKKRRVLALTRYEYFKVTDIFENKMIMGCDSQDSWVYLSPINMNGMSIDFGLGIPGCDNRIAYELAKNYNVVNPSYSIKTYHYHESNVRNYNPNNRLNGDYLQVHME
jgi:hypothetical protein